MQSPSLNTLDSLNTFILPIVITKTRLLIILIWALPEHLLSTFRASELAWACMSLHELAWARMSWHELAWARNPKDFKRFQKIPKISKNFQKIPKENYSIALNSSEANCSVPSSSQRIKELELPQRSWLGRLKINNSIVN